MDLILNPWKWIWAGNLFTELYWEDMNVGTFAHSVEGAFVCSCHTNNLMENIWIHTYFYQVSVFLKNSGVLGSSYGVHQSYHHLVFIYYGWFVCFSNYQSSRRYLWETELSLTLFSKGKILFSPTFTQILAFWADIWAGTMFYYCVKSVRNWQSKH